MLITLSIQNSFTTGKSTKFPTKPSNTSTTPSVCCRTTLQKVRILADLAEDPNENVALISEHTPNFNTVKKQSASNALPLLLPVSRR